MSQVVIAPALLGPQVLLDQANGKAKKTVHLAHPFGITTSQVIVDGDHVNTAAGKGIEVAGQGGHQGFAFARFHLSDLALMQHHAADQLHIEMAHAQHPLAGFAHHRKGLRQDLIEDGALVLQRSSILQTLTKGRRACS